MNEEYEEYEDYDTYEEVPSEEADYEELTASDFALITGLVLLVCFGFAIIASVLRKTFKNLHLKVGDRFEVKVETKES